MQNLKKEKGKKLLSFLRRKVRINAKIKATAPDFRVIVDKSNMYIKAQVVDQNGHVVAHISDKGIKATTKTERATLAGQALADLLKKLSIQQAAFDRNGNLYHGRVKAFAE
jgi:large subunit ribosomal protein L18